MKVKIILKKRWKLIAAILIIMLVSGRIIYVNAFYPQTVRKYYNQGDTFQYSKLDITVNKMTAYTKDTFLQYAKDNMSGFNSDVMSKMTTDYYVYIVNITVNNPTDGNIKVSYGQMAIDIENTSNGSNSYLNKLINHEEYGVTVQAETTKDISIAYTIPKTSTISNMEFEKIIDKKCTYSFKDFYNLIIVNVNHLEQIK